MLEQRLEQEADALWEREVKRRGIYLLPRLCRGCHWWGGLQPHCRWWQCQPEQLATTDNNKNNKNNHGTNKHGVGESGWEWVREQYEQYTKGGREGGGDSQKWGEEEEERPVERKNARKRNKKRKRKKERGFVFHIRERNIEIPLLF